MNRLLLASLIAGTALTTLASAPSRAADIPMQQAPLAAATPVLATYNWTGFYLGANVGYGWGDTRVRDIILPSVSPDPDGFFLGGQLGYNYQIGQFVVGIEGDIQWSDMSARSGAGFLGSNTRAEIEWFGTVRGRIGYAFDRFMVYGTGGVAFGDVRLSSNFPYRETQTHVGWVLGAGVEAAVWQNFTVKLEYQYLDLGRESYDSIATAIGGLPGDVRSDTTAHTIRVGLNYKF